MTPREVAADRAIKVALLGYGYAGRTFHAPLIAATPGLELTTVVTRDPAKAQNELPGVKTLPDPLDAFHRSEVDLVVVATPNDTHHALALAALQAGKHVVVDKPFTLDLAQARDLIVAAEKAGRLLSVFHNRRWDSDFLTVQRAIAGGLLGDVAHFESHFDRFRPAVKSRWRESAVPGGGIWFDLGPHLVDQALQLFGLPSGVTGHMANQRSGAVVADWSHVVLEYPTLRVILHASMLVAGGVNRFTVHGARGSLIKRRADRQEAQLLSGTTPGASQWGADPDAALFIDGNGAEQRIEAQAGDQRQYYAGIDAALRTHAPPPVTAMQALAVMAVIEAGVRSAQRRASVELTLSPHECRDYRR